ncbi:aldo/keto reductase [Syncephalis pseudoplumigaleata]|uniref:Aldo/keto reductase n=1 Tax=Syncephalis pseudoplumigaleata TaxID=1712513 RepID=A0A4P9Z0A2_9FUNG|nr:aldo/keto reductase [Syncephalis pseudoplumigaleata]|eukprot:RKP25836.1 aldo/keto reductase [Syncephalis pseudoplumigaleata]
MAQSFDIPKRQLGRNGPLLPAIGLGCMSMSPGFYSDNTKFLEAKGNVPVDENDEMTASALATLKRAVESGCVFWDTSNAYGMGHNEKLIARVLKEHRDKVFICTKFGIRVLPDGGYTVCGEPDYIRQCCEESLARLGVDSIDLYYQHRIDPHVPIETSIGAMAELVREGKVKHLGLSECSVETLRRAHKVHPIAAVQVEYSPWSREIEENGLLDACKELGVAVVAYSPLGRGLLTGTIRTPEDLAATDWRASNPRFQKEAFEKNLALIEAFKRISKRKGCTVGQLCLAWVLRQSDNIFIIPGTKRIKYLEENLGASSVALTDEDDQELRKYIEDIGVAGERYGAHDMSLVNK